MTQIALLKLSGSRWVLNAIRVPSGDHAGFVLKENPLFERLVWPLPSGFIT